jgi:hypothetical protein
VTWTEQDWQATLMASELLREDAEAALAAERDRADAMTALCDTNIESAQAWKDRADRAEVALDQAPHDSMCAVDYMVALD